MDDELLTKPHLIIRREKGNASSKFQQLLYNTNLFVLHDGKSIKNQVSFWESEYLLITYVSKGRE